MKKTILALCLTTLGVASHANAYTIDGQLSDWGLQSNWSVNPSVKVAEVEDQTGGSGTLLSPGYGGQAYDAEALYVDWDANNLYIAIVTGLKPNNPHNPAQNTYGAGDILFNFGGGNSFEFGLVVRNPANNSGLDVGSLYKVTALDRSTLWKTAYPSWGGPSELQPYDYPVGVKSGQFLATGALDYQDIGFKFPTPYSNPNDDHYVIEARVPLSAFGSYWNLGLGGPVKDLYIWWTAYCANDVIGAEIQGVPEPGTLLLSALGLAGLGLLRRRRFEDS